jgi:3-dehydroquinate dehydratase-2
MRTKILIVNGPGLGDLADYDGNGYGGLTLQTIREGCEQLCNELQVDLDFRQTDDQEQMLQWIAKDSENFDSLIINPVGYSHVASLEPGFYQSAMQVAAHLKKPVTEVHINNIYRQSAEITQSLQEPGGDMGFICGLGMYGYLMAIKASIHRISASQS